MQFSYIDEDGDNNFLGNDENEIFEASKEQDYHNYLLKLNLIINRYNENNKEKLIKKEEININQNNNNNKELNEFKEKENYDIEKVKKEFNDKLKKINILYKN